jgi:hypothetical protein
MLLAFCAEQIRGKLTISYFWPRFKMKTLETLDTKRVDSLLIFPMNICMSHADKLSNGYGHCKTARDKILGGNLQTDWVLKTGEDSVQELNQDIKLKEGGCFAIIPTWVACESQNEERWSYRVFSTVVTSSKGRLDRTCMMVWKIFSDERCSLELTEDLEAWLLQYLNLDSHRGKMWWLETWIAQRSRLAFYHVN